MLRRLAPMLVAAALVAAPAAAQPPPPREDPAWDPIETLPADPDERPPEPPDTAWHVDGLLSIIIPLGPSSYGDPASIGGRVGARVHRRWLEATLDLGLFTREDLATVEQLAYRVRALAGVRQIRPVTSTRSVILRAAAGVELAGFDEEGATGWVDAHRPGLAAEVGAESRSALAWGTVTLGIALGVTAQPLGDPDASEARYVGVDLVAGVGFGF